MNLMLNSTQHIVSGIRASLIEHIKPLVEDKLHGSGFIHDSSYLEGDPKRYTQLCMFGQDEEEQQVYYSSWGLDILGYTQDGVITDAYMCIATEKYANLSTEQLMFAYQVALEHGEELS